MNENKKNGLLIYKKISSENNLYVKFLTENDEILSGLVYGGASKKTKNIYQIGFFLDLKVKLKKIDSPNSIFGELSQPYYYNIYDDKYKLNCILTIVSLLNISIIEGQKIVGLYNLSKIIINIILNEKKWLVDFFLYLLSLLKLIGYEIDFNKNKNFKYFYLNSLQFEEKNKNHYIIFPHGLLEKTEKINLSNTTSFFKIFENIMQNHHLNNMNLNIPNNYFKFKKIILEFLSK